MKHKSTKIIIGIVILAAVAFGIVSLVWYVRYVTLFKPLISAEGMVQDTEDKTFYSMDCDTDENTENWFTLSVRTPSFLSFQGSVVLCQDFLVDTENDMEAVNEGYDLSLYYWPKLFPDNEIKWQMYEFDDDGSITAKGCEIVTDTDLNLISQTDFNNSYLNYDECIDRMKTVFDEYIVAVLGKENIK